MLLVKPNIVSKCGTGDVTFDENCSSAHTVDQDVNEQLAFLDETDEAYSKDSSQAAVTSVPVVAAVSFCPPRDQLPPNVSFFLVRYALSVASHECRVYIHSELLIYNRVLCVMDYRLFAHHMHIYSWWIIACLHIICICLPSLKTPDVDFSIFIFIFVTLHSKTNFRWTFCDILKHYTYLITQIIILILIFMLWMSLRRLNANREVTIQVVSTRDPTYCNASVKNNFVWVLAVRIVPVGFSCWLLLQGSQLRRSSSVCRTRVSHIATWWWRPWLFLYSDHITRLAWDLTLLLLWCLLLKDSLRRKMPSGAKLCIIYL